MELTEKDLRERGIRRSREEVTEEAGRFAYAILVGMPTVRWVPEPIGELSSGEAEAMGEGAWISRPRHLTSPTRSPSSHPGMRPCLPRRSLRVRPRQAGGQRGPGAPEAGGGDTLRGEGRKGEQAARLSVRGWGGGAGREQGREGSEVGGAPRRRTKLLHQPQSRPVPRRERKAAPAGAAHSAPSVPAVNFG